MSDWFDKQKQSSSSFRELLKDRIEKANPRRQLTSEDSKRLTKLANTHPAVRQGVVAIFSLHQPNFKNCYKFFYYCFL